MVPTENLKDLKDYRVIITSTDIFKEPLENYFANVKLIRNSVDQNIFINKRLRYPSAFTLGWAGNPRHNKYKNFDFFERLKKDLHFNFKSATGNIKTKEGMADFYNSIDLLVITSYSEGEPLTAIESSSCGTAAAGFNVGVIPQTTSYVSDWGYKNLRDKILELSNEKKSKLSINARKRYDSFCNKQIIKKYWMDLLSNM